MGDGFLISRQTGQLIQRMATWFRTHVEGGRLPGNPGQVIPFQFCRFELTAVLAPKGSATAEVCPYDGTNYTAPETGAISRTVYELAGIYRGWARDADASPDPIAGAKGVAMKLHDRDAWVVVWMEPHATLMTAAVNEGNGVTAADATFTIDTQTVIQPTDQAGWVDGAAPTTASNTGKYVLANNELCWFRWDDSAEVWECIGPVAAAGAIRFGKVQTGFSNASMSAKRTVSVKSCGSDGTNVEGNAYDVYTPMLGTQLATSLFDDDIVGFLPDKDGNLIICTPCHDDPMNVIKAWGGTADALPPGWGEWSGSTGRVLAGYTGSGVYDAIGATGGATTHTHTAHSDHTIAAHDDHAAHDHADEGCICVDSNLDGSTELVWDYVAGGTGEEAAMTHTAHAGGAAPGLGHDNNHSTEDNLDPFKVVQWMIRDS